MASFFEPTLTYERQFDSDEGDTHLIVHDYLTEVNGSDRLMQNKSKIRKFQGECVKELLFTLDNFRKNSSDMHLDVDEQLDKWPRILGHRPRKKYNKMIVDNGPYLDTVDGIQAQVYEVLAFYTKDPQAKKTMFSAIERGKFKNPIASGIVEQHSR